MLAAGASKRTTHIISDPNMEEKSGMAKWAHDYRARAKGTVKGERARSRVTLR